MNACNACMCQLAVSRAKDKFDRMLKNADTRAKSKVRNTHGHSGTCLHRTHVHLFPQAKKSEDAEDARAQQTAKRREALTKQKIERIKRQEKLKKQFHRRLADRQRKQVLIL